MSVDLRKPRPKLLDKRQVKADITKVDREENAKVKARSKGHCEVIVVFPAQPGRGPMYAMPLICKCPRRGSQVHHLMAGIGRRNRGSSILHTAKLHVCDRCHAEIHGHVLVPLNATERESAATVRYERVQ